MLYISVIYIVYGAEFIDLINIGPTHYVIEKMDNNTFKRTIYNKTEIVNETLIKTENHIEVIQGSLESIEENGGGILHLQTGTYMINKNIILYNNVHLMGDGMYNTIIKLVDYAPSFIVGTRRKSGFIRASFMNNIIISNLTIDGNKDYQYNDYDHLYGRFGIFTEACDNVWFDHVRIINCQGYGFDPHGWKKGPTWSNYLTITNCVANDNEWDGFTLDQTYNIVIQNCTAINNGRHGYNIITGSKYVTVSNNIAIGNGYYDPHNGSGCGIMIQNNNYYGTSNVVISDNYLIDSKKAGICLNDVYDIYVERNKINQSCTCMEFIDVKYIYVNNNKCETRRFNRTEESIMIYDKDGIKDEPVIYLNENKYKKVECDGTTNSAKRNGYSVVVSFIIIGMIFYAIEHTTNQADYIMYMIWAIGMIVFMFINAD